MGSQSRRRIGFAASVAPARCQSYNKDSFGLGCCLKVCNIYGHYPIELKIRFRKGNRIRGRDLFIFSVNFTLIDSSVASKRFSLHSSATIPMRTETAVTMSEFENQIGFCYNSFEKSVVKLK